MPSRRLALWEACGWLLQRAFAGSRRQFNDNLFAWVREKDARALQTSE
jgi:hypothetical protein